MNRFNFHGVDLDHNDLYTYAKDQEKAQVFLGTRIVDAVLPGLSNSVPTTGSDMSKGSLSYQHLLVSGNKVTPCSADLLMSKEERLRYVNDIVVTSKIVDQSKLSPFAFFDSKSIDRLTKSAIYLKPRKRSMMENSEKLFNPSMHLNSFQQLIESSANGLIIHHHATPETQKLFKDTSRLAATIPIRNSCSESKKLWDKFVTYAQNRGF